MRSALAQAVHHTRHRRVFQRVLLEQPMMRAVLADLGLELEAAVALVMRLSRSIDCAQDDPLEAARARLLIPAAKYWVCKIAPAFIYEALECLGGNGYVEEAMLARLYREAPLNAIWEGSGNVMCLDVLRAFSRDGEGSRAVLAALGQATADLPGAADALASVDKFLARGDAEAHARAVVERIATVAAAAALRDSAPAELPEIFARVQLHEGRRITYGTATLSGHQVTQLVDRVLPA
jgi:putative acyl-CoA dehydrogenase